MEETKITESQAYEEYQERTKKSSDVANQLSWCVILILIFSLAGKNDYRQFYVMAAAGLAYLLLSMMQYMWQGVTIWIVKQRIHKGATLEDYPEWIGFVAWIFYYVKMLVIAAGTLYGIFTFLKML